MLLKVIQTAIFIAVAWANIYFEVTPNPFVVGGFALIVAYLATAIPLHIYDWWKQLTLRREQARERNKSVRSHPARTSPVVRGRSSLRR